MRFQTKFGQSPRALSRCREDEHMYLLAMNAIKTRFNQFLNDEDGINTIEIVVLVAILIGLAILFKDSIFKYAKEIFALTLDVNKVVPQELK